MSVQDLSTTNGRISSPTRVCEEDAMFTRALAMQSSCKSCSPPLDWVFWKLDLPCLLLRRSVFFTDTGSSRNAPFHDWHHFVRTWPKYPYENSCRIASPSSQPPCRGRCTCSRTPTTSQPRIRAHYHNNYNYYYYLLLLLLLLFVLLLP